MSVLPRALQEEVLRNPKLKREKRLKKVVLSFEILMHYYHLSFFPYGIGIAKWYSAKVTRCITFTNHGGWLRVLNTALVLIGFINDGKENWLFSTLGTHYLENFFGRVRQNAHSDDRFRRAIQIITQNTVIVHVMDELKVRPPICGRENLGGTIIGPGTAMFSSESGDTLVQSFLQFSSLHFDTHDMSQLLDCDELITILAKWITNDKHHKTDSGRKIDLAGSVSGHGVLARNHGRKVSDEE
jgi:hypothetical protein